MSKPVYFRNSAALRKWFATNSGKAKELVVGYMKRGTGVASVTWPESVDEALCVGWIDGVRRRIDERRYQIRFTPRRAGSHWSNVNIRRVGELKKAGRMKPAGLAAFAGRSQSRTGRAHYEQRRKAKLRPEHVREFKRHAAAWKYYGTVPPGYRHLVNFWITSAKKPETRAKRLKLLIAACAQGKRLGWDAKVV
jgi:uncharacterized protein YdeI (YjbR/CyaY-like superfamily)